MKKDAYRMFYGAAMVLTVLFVLCCLGGWVGLRTTQSATPFWALALGCLCLAFAFYKKH